MKSPTCSPQFDSATAAAVYGRKNPKDIDESCEQHAGRCFEIRRGAVSRAGTLDRPGPFLRMENGVEELKAIFSDRPDLLFRHFENCNVATMRWHCGRDVREIVNLRDGKGVIVERLSFSRGQRQAEN